jgi:hypothetical protein
MVGVIRPTAERVLQNIQSTYQYFQTKYPQHTFDIWLGLYKSDLMKPIAEAGYNCIWLDPISETDILPAHRLPPPNVNRWRMLFSMHTVLRSIPAIDSYDMVLRLRSDIEICALELHPVLDSTSYYVVMDEPTTCIDNLGYGTPSVMLSIWNLEHADTKELLKTKNNEEFLFTITKLLSYSVVPFRFHSKLYQSSDDVFDGVKQWSKRNREWIYDGKNLLKL